MIGVISLLVKRSFSRQRIPAGIAEMIFSGLTSTVRVVSMNGIMRCMRSYVLSIFLLTLCLVSMSVHAVPSFARQTSMPCQSCHTIFPELTTFGRSFKLNGYTLTNMKQIQSASGKELSLNKTFPLSVMVQVGVTHQKETLPGKQNNSVEFPQELSLYFAGEITPHVGTFLQLTYSQPEDNLSFDMADIRYANRTTLGGSDLVYGVNLSNMPGMEDVWNTTPAWRYPYASPDTETGSIPGPGADVLVNNLMGAGLGAYAMLDDHWYGSVNFYRTAMIGTDVPDVDGSLSGVAPYIRLAWQNTFSNMGYLQLGTYVLQASYSGGRPVDGAPASGVAGKSDSYTDLALDATYQQPFEGGNSISMHAVYINEDQSLDSTVASNPDNSLKQLRVDGNYLFGHSAQLSLGYFSTSGDSYDFVNSVYSDYGNAGYIAEADYLPWENTRFSLQYTSYIKFDGSSSNYDGGGGRSASDNNTMYANAWLMW